MSLRLAGHDDLVLVGEDHGLDPVPLTSRSGSPSSGERNPARTMLLGEATYASPELSFSVLVWLWPATFMAAIFCLAAGLLGVAAQVGRRGRTLAVLGGLGFLGVVGVWAARWS